jgi:hypothetical protein
MEKARAVDLRKLLKYSLLEDVKIPAGVLPAKGGMLFGASTPLGSCTKWPWVVVAPWSCRKASVEPIDGLRRTLSDQWRWNLKGISSPFTC